MAQWSERLSLKQCQCEFESHQAHNINMKYLILLLTFYTFIVSAQIQPPAGIGDSSNIILWLSPDTGVYKSDTTIASINDTIYQWHDLSKNQFIFTNTHHSRRPIFDTLNGNNYIKFTPGDLLGNSRVADTVNGLDEFSIFIVIKSNQTNTDRGFMYWKYPPDNQDDGLCLRYDQNGANTGRSNVIKTGLLGNNANNQIESTDNTQTTERQVLTITWKTGQRLKLYIDGILNDSSNNTVTGPMSGLQEVILGKGAKDNNINEGWDGYIGTVIFYNTKFEDSVIQDVSEVLPIELISFTAELINNYAKLTWTTATETDNDYFTIERSINGVDFNIIGIIEGSDNSTIQKTYTFIDEAVLPGVNYYRLKQTDFDGSYKYYNIVAVNNDNQRIIIQDGVIRLINFETISDITVYTSTGQQILNSANNDINIRNLPHGLYLIQINGDIFKIIK